MKPKRPPKLQIGSDFLYLASKHLQSRNLCSEQKQIWDVYQRLQSANLQDPTNRSVVDSCLQNLQLLEMGPIWVGIWQRMPTIWKHISTTLFQISATAGSGSKIPGIQLRAALCACGLVLSKLPGVPNHTFWAEKLESWILTLSYGLLNAYRNPDVEKYLICHCWGTYGKCKYFKRVQQFLGFPGFRDVSGYVRLFLELGRSMFALGPSPMVRWISFDFGYQLLKQKIASYTTVRRHTGWYGARAPKTGAKRNNKTI